MLQSSGQQIWRREMQVAANRNFGQLLYTLMRERMVAAGYEMPLVAIGSLGGTLDLTVHKIHSLSHARAPQPPEVDLQLAHFALEFNPDVQILVETVMAMAWLSHLEPNEVRHAVQILVRVVGFFEKYGCRAIDEAETQDLHERILALLAQQQEPDTLGAVGDAAYGMATQPFAALRVRKNTLDARRRRAYLQNIRRLCLELDGTRMPADQKAVHARIGEALLAELKASKAAHVDQTMGRFWGKAGLLLGRKD